MFEPRFISFDGEPMGGRTPVRFTVHAPKGVSVSPHLLGLLQAEYAAFQSSTQVSIAQLHTRTRFLYDGSRVHFTSVQGHDTVDFYPAQFAAEEPTAGGIGFYVTDVDGNVVMPYAKQTSSSGGLATFVPVPQVMYFNKNGGIKIKAVSALRGGEALWYAKGHKKWFSSGRVADRQQRVAFMTPTALAVRLGHVGAYTKTRVDFLYRWFGGSGAVAAFEAAENAAAKPVQLPPSPNVVAHANVELGTIDTLAETPLAVFTGQIAKSSAFYLAHYGTYSSGCYGGVTLHTGSVPTAGGTSALAVATQDLGAVKLAPGTTVLATNNTALMGVGVDASGRRVNTVRFDLSDGVKPQCAVSTQTVAAPDWTHTVSGTSTKTYTTSGTTDWVINGGALPPRTLIDMHMTRTEDHPRQVSVFTLVDRIKIDATGVLAPVLRTYTVNSAGDAVTAQTVRNVTPSTNYQLNDQDLNYGAPAGTSETSSSTVTTVSITDATPFAGGEFVYAEKRYTANVQSTSKSHATSAGIVTDSSTYSSTSSLSIKKRCPLYLNDTLGLSIAAEAGYEATNVASTVMKPVPAKSTSFALRAVLNGVEVANDSLDPFGAVILMERQGASPSATLTLDTVGAPNPTWALNGSRVSTYVTPGQLTYSVFDMLLDAATEPVDPFTLFEVYQAHDPATDAMVVHVSFDGTKYHGGKLQTWTFCVDGAGRFKRLVDALKLPPLTQLHLVGDSQTSLVSI